jgi:glycosyltransferase involved in cell wall biosynthesis
MASEQRPLRVCFAILSYPPEFGGHGIQLERSLPYLEREGVEVTILTQQLPSATDPRVQRLLPRGSSVQAIGRRIVEMRRFLRRGRFDVLHSAIQGWEFLLNLPHARRVGLPVAYEMVILGGDDPPAIARSRGGRIKLRLMRNVGAWLALSRVFRPSVLTAGIPGDRFRVAPGGVETDRYRPRNREERTALRKRLGLSADARIVISVGVVVRRKGMDRVVAAWKQLRPQVGRDLLLIVGPDSPQDRAEPELVAELRRAGESSELAGTLALTGRIDNVEEYLGASDLFVFLSRREGMGYVIPEAMACGLPCVVSPLDGIAEELVEEGRTGFIARAPDDSEQVAEILRPLLEDAELRRSLGVSARRVVEERFSMEARARTLRGVYDALVAGRSVAGGAGAGSAR